MKSIIEAVGTEEFTRVRIGIGRPPSGTDEVDYVLGTMSSEERSRVEEAVEIDNDTLVTFLGRTHLFHDFRRREVEAILPYIMLVRADPNTVIFDQGDEGDAWYVLLTGKVSIERDTRDNPPHQLAALSSGDCFGEVCFGAGTGSVSARRRAITSSRAGTDACRTCSSCTGSKASAAGCGWARSSFWRASEALNP